MDKQKASPGDAVFIGPEEIMYRDSNDTVHLLTGALWSPDNMNYMDRVVLTARLRAIAEVVDPLSFQHWIQKIDQPNRR